MPIASSGTNIAQPIGPIVTRTSNVPVTAAERPTTLRGSYPFG